MSEDNQLSRGSIIRIITITKLLNYGQPTPDRHRNQHYCSRLTNYRLVSCYLAIIS